MASGEELYPIPLPSHRPPTSPTVSGYLLPEDVERILAHSARRWDLLASVPETAAAK